MKTRWHSSKGLSVLTTWIILSLLLAGTAKTHAAFAAGKQQGMSFAAWWPGLYSSPAADQALSELKDDAANWLSLIVTRYQDTIASTTIYSAQGTPGDEELVHVIDQAHRLGMKVMLKPHLELANDPTHWRGDIGIGFSEGEWAAWFVSYKDFINHYAQLAQTHGADQFSVGCELVSTESRAADWQSVIAGVRAVFNGPLTYAANFGSEGSISWWDRLDLIGVDAYYPLTTTNDPTLAELKSAWVPIVASLKALSENQKKPVLFTEIGYRSLDGANRHPWDYQISGTVDLQEQADLYRAVLESVFNQSWFAGMYWWTWDPDPLQGGPCDMGYSPHDKPAEDVLRLWYGAPPKSRQGIPGLDTSRTMPVYADTPAAGWYSWSWGGTYDFASTEHVHSGAYAIKAVIPSWGAVTLHHEAFASSRYYWLELYVYKSSDTSALDVWFSDENDFPTRRVEDCRYTEGQTITAGVWTRVLIPLQDLRADNRLLQRLSVGNGRDQPVTFYVDDVRLIAASWKTFLPLILKH